MHRKPTPPPTRIHRTRKTGGQEVQGSPSTSILRRRWHSTPFICRAAKILTDACNQGRLHARAVSAVVQSLPREFMCRIFSSTSLLIPSGISFIPQTAQDGYLFPPKDPERRLPRERLPRNPNRSGSVNTLAKVTSSA